jgi:hypothetical protein
MSCAIIWKIFGAQRKVVGLDNGQTGELKIACLQLLTIQKPSKTRSLQGRNDFTSSSVAAISLITSSELLSIYFEI